MSLRAILLAVGLAPIPSGAAIIYNDLPNFVAAIQHSYAVEDFESIAVNTTLGKTRTFSGSGQTFTASTMVELYGVSYGGSRMLSAAYHWDPIVLTFAGNPTAVGGYFFGQDVNGDPNGGPITLALSDGTGVTIVTDDTHFTGFVTSGGTTITSLTITGYSMTPLSWATIDDLHMGYALAGLDPVPEPTSVALLGGALLGLGWLRRRSR